jgi:hypothetical protein
MSDGVGNELTDKELIESLSGDPPFRQDDRKPVLGKKDPGQDNFTALLLRYV